MVDEGPDARGAVGAGLRQAQSAAAHAAAHLQLVGVGDWRPQGTNPSWNDDPRVTGSDD